MSNVPGDSPEPIGDDEIDRRFSEMVSGIESQMSWQLTQSEPDTDPKSDGKSATTTLDPDTAERRQQRRDERRAQRSEEVAEFAAEQASKQAAYDADTEHFVPPDPPPLTMPRLKTIGALLLMAFGVFLVLGPNFLSVGPTGLMVMALALVLSGSTLLFTSLRRHPIDPDGGDDGSRV